jgi:selenocysteine lyase/cysteine desulfurase
MKNYRAGFPILGQYLYANTASSGLIHESTIEWRRQHDQDFLKGASNMRMESAQIISETRKAVGGFFGCTYENVALVQNFSLGLNLLLEGLDERMKVLLLENDYPSVNWSFENRNFPISYCKIDEDLEENMRRTIANDQISILALSLVQWINGVAVDLEFLSELKEDFPQLLIIADGTQFCGTTDFDFKTSAIDVLGASSYKWLLAGYGNAFLLFKDRIKELANVEVIGFNAANADRKNRDKIRFAKKFEPGHLDTLNFGTLKHSLGLLTALGKDEIANRLKSLSNKAKKEFSAMGLLEDVVISRKVHSTIFNVKGNDIMFRHIARNGIICSQRGNGIRFSFHLYNTMQDIDQIVRILKEKI